MKTQNITVSSLIRNLCIPILVVVSLSASATIQLTTATGLQAIGVMNQQSANAEQGEQVAKDSTPKEEKDQAAIDEERKKYCATARKNLELLRSNMQERTFTTEDGKIVKYTPDQLQKMIKESEAAEKANCD